MSNPITDTAIDDLEKTSKGYLAGHTSAAIFFKQEETAKDVLRLIEALREARRERDDCPINYCPMRVNHHGD